mmetsp:Transcript_68509/g.147880  ORF Transcript_68509/g.147880 Transcript_68509/m.147880 type:complete len:221 (-) Transcript_68509:1006-1668(-)
MRPKLPTLLWPRSFAYSKSLSASSLLMSLDTRETNSSWVQLKNLLVSLISLLYTALPMHLIRISLIWPLDFSLFKSESFSKIASLFFILMISLLSLLFLTETVPILCDWFSYMSLNRLSSCLSSLTSLVFILSFSLYEWTCLLMLSTLRCISYTLLYLVLSVMSFSTLVWRFLSEFLSFCNCEEEEGLSICMLMLLSPEVIITFVFVGFLFMVLFNELVL